MSELEDALHRIGLTDYEAKIYLALLEIGESTASAVTKKLGIHVGRLYDILDSLAQKGLVSIMHKNGTKYFTAAPPQQMQDLLAQKGSELAAQQKLVAQLLPRFEAILNSTKTSPHVEVYTGFEGYKTAYLKEAQRYGPKKTLCVLGVRSENAYDKELTNFFLFKLFPLRQKSKVKIRKIDDESLRQKPYSVDPGEHRYLSLNSAITINVIDDLTLISWSHETMMVITIEDLSTADGFRSQFDHLWKIAKP